MPLYPYQEKQVNPAREKLRKINNLCFQLPTGGGKTAIVAELTSRAWKKDTVTWFIVPRNNLLDQASEHFQKWKIPHSLIGHGRKESRAFKTHIVSRDTLVRRYKKIINWPDLMFIDEVHIAIPRQNEIIRICNLSREKIGKPSAKVIGLTATPETLSGIGLHTSGGGPYEDIVWGESIPSLTSMGYLSPLRYMCPPPPEGIESLHRRGTEFNPDELDALLKKKKVYGDAIDHYRKYGAVKKICYSFPDSPTIQHRKNYAKGKPAIFFLRTVKAAHEMAEQFRNAGFSFHCIEGAMKKKTIHTLIQAHRDGKIDGLTNCDIGTYGLDIPRIEYGASLRPTLSRPLYFQKVGRCLRIFEERYCRKCSHLFTSPYCPSCRSPGLLVYKKEETIFMDHVGLIDEHYHPDFPGVPLFYLKDPGWNFYGTQKRKRMKKPDRSINCPYLDYTRCGKKTCIGCPHLPAGGKKKTPEVVIIKTELVEAKKPISMAERPPEEKREYIQQISQNIDEYETAELSPGPVERLLEIAADLGRSPMWVYHMLVQKTTDPTEKVEKNKAVDVPLLFAIQRVKGNKPGWVWFQRKRLEKKLS